MDRESPELIRLSGVEMAGSMDFTITDAYFEDLRRRKERRKDLREKKQGQKAVLKRGRGHKSPSLRGAGKRLKKSA